MMRIIHRYLLREYLTNYLFCSAGFLVLLIGNFIFEISDFLVDKRASLAIICLLVYYQIPYLLMDVFPAAVLFGVFLGLGRLTRERELDVIRTAGWSFPALTAPLLLVTLFLCIGAFYFNDLVVPAANFRYEQEIRKLIHKDFIPFIQENVVFKGPDDRFFYLRRVNEGNRTVEGVMIYQSNGRFPRLITAASGWIEEQFWHLKKGNYYELDAEGNITTVTSFEELVEDVGEDLSIFLGQGKGVDEMSRAELKQYMELYAKSGLDISSFAVNYHLKVALPFAGLILAFLGLPFATMFPKSGRAIGLAVSMLLIMVYFFTTVLFRELGVSGLVSPFWAAWLPNVFFLALGIGLLFRVIK
ncbi:MAG TPA: YjgP/YjgQ family permease [Firmicutes bacterium]|nr:YjgP/YjgQ family permease [Bacillota bacterium]